MSGQLALGALLACAAVTVGTLLGWVVAAGLGAWTGQSRRLSPSTRVALLAQARLAPLALTMLLVAVQVVGFARFEAGRDESAGPLLIAIAAIGVALSVEAGISGLRAWRHTRAIERAWRRSATPMTLPRWPRRAWRIERRFPVVAVLGVARPELYVACHVAEVCTTDELAAIAAHEAAHVASRDNLVRWLYRATPGACLTVPLAERLETAWAAAAEEAADAAARRTTPGVELASALTKVVRLAHGLPHESMPASALIGRGDLTARVHRLLEPPATPRRRAFAWIPAAAAAAGALNLFTPSALATVHELFELLVRR